MKEIEEDLAKAFVYKCKGELKEYIGSKVDLMRNKNRLGTVKTIQSVIVKNLEESFDLAGCKDPKMPAVADQVLFRDNHSDMLGPVETTKF